MLACFQRQRCSYPEFVRVTLKQGQVEKLVSQFFSLPVFGRKKDFLDILISMIHFLFLGGGGSLLLH